MRVFSLLLTGLVILSTLSLSQAEGRLLGFGEYPRALVVLGLLVSITVFEVLFIRRLGKTILAIDQKRIAHLMIVYLIIVPMLALFVGYLSYYPAPYPFLVEDAAITVTVNDIERTSGHVNGSFQIKALRDGLDQILWGNMGSTGIIKNVTTSKNDKLRTFQITQQSGLWQLELRFPNSLMKGQEVSFQMGFDIISGEPRGDVYWRHDVTVPTQNLQVTIVVPKERPCKAADARSEDVVEIGTKWRHEPIPLISDDNTKLTWTKAGPEEGRAYIVTCH